MKTLSGAADLEVRGPRGGFDESAVRALARDPDVAVASPVVEVDARIEGRDEALRIYGVDAFRAARGHAGARRRPRDDAARRPAPRQCVPHARRRVVARRQARRHAARAGRHARASPLAVAGLAEASTGERYAVMDIAAAQDRVRAPRRRCRASTFACGRARRSRRRARADRVAAARRRRGRAAAGERGDDRRACRAPIASISTCSRSSRCSPGALLVFSTQALSVVRRRAQFALLRTLGVTRAALARWLVARGRAGRDARARCSGIAGGYALAYVVLRVVGADLGAGYFRGVAPRVVVDPVAALRVRGRRRRGGGVGQPRCRRAKPRARSPPRRSRRATSRRRSRGCARRGPALALLAAGAAMTMLPPVAGLPLFGYASIALLLVGTLLLLPRIASVALLADVPVPRTAPGGARARAVARRAGAGRREPRDDRRERVADGVDGDHGRVVPPVARRLARARPAGRRVSSRGQRRRHRVPRRRHSSAPSRRCRASRASRSCACRTCCSTRRSRASRCSRATCRAHDPGRALAARRRSRTPCATAIRRRCGSAKRWPISTALRPGARIDIPARIGDAHVRRRGRLARLRAAAGRDRDRRARLTSR